jgi:hypothetical protein
MNKETYIIIGACVFAFLVGQRVKKALKGKNKEIKTEIRGKAVKKKKKGVEKPVSNRKAKVQRAFTWAMLILVFLLLILMIPSLSRDLLGNNGNYGEDLILRIIIVAFSIYILFMGYIKLNKQKK